MGSFRNRKDQLQEWQNWSHYQAHPAETIHQRWASPYPDAEEREEQHNIPACSRCERHGTRADNLLNPLIFLLQTVSPGVSATAQRWMKLAVTLPGWVCATVSGRSSSPQPVLGEKQFDLVCNLEYLSHGHWDEELMDSLQGTATPFWIGYFPPRAQAVPAWQKRMRVRAPAAPPLLIGFCRPHLREAAWRYRAVFELDEVWWETDNLILLVQGWDSLQIKFHLLVTPTGCICYQRPLERTWTRGGLALHICGAESSGTLFWLEGLIQLIEHIKLSTAFRHISFAAATYSHPSCFSLPLTTLRDVVPAEGSLRHQHLSADRAVWCLQSIQQVPHLLLGIWNCRGERQEAPRGLAVPTKSGRPPLGQELRERLGCAAGWCISAGFLQTQPPVLFCGLGGMRFTSTLCHLCPMMVFSARAGVHWSPQDGERWLLAGLGSHRAWVLLRGTGHRVPQHLASGCSRAGDERWKEQTYLRNAASGTAVWAQHGAGGTVEAAVGNIYCVPSSRTRRAFLLQ